MQITGVNCRTELHNEKKSKGTQTFGVDSFAYFLYVYRYGEFFAESQPRELDPFCAACFIQRHR